MKKLSSKKLVLLPPVHPYFLFAFLALALVAFVVSTLVTNAFTALFEVIGFERSFSFVLAVLITVVSLLASPVNVPIASIEKQVLVPTVEFVQFFGFLYPVPKVVVESRKVVVAVNAGGAIVPLAVVLLVLAKLARVEPRAKLLQELLLCTSLAVAFGYVVAKPVSGVGIVMPAFSMPLFTSLIAVIVVGPTVYAVPIAYVSAVLGSLLGADILHLVTDWKKLNASFLSIGGAGIFDGVYLSGLVSVALTVLLAA